MPGGLTKFAFFLLVLLLGARLQAGSLIQFSAPIYHITEGIDQIEVVVQRRNDLETVVNVDFATTNVSAMAGQITWMSQPT